MNREFQVNQFIQAKLRERMQTSTTAVEAAGWLAQAGMLKDSKTRPGSPLRNLLRAGKIIAARQEMNRRWFIDRQR